MRKDFLCNKLFSAHIVLYRLNNQPICVEYVTSILNVADGQKPNIVAADRRGSSLRSGLLIPSGKADFRQPLLV